MKVSKQNIFCFSCREKNMDDYKCTLEKEGYLAHYYPGSKYNKCAIIAAAGSNCGEQTSLAMFEYLRKQGFNVLVLGYYLWPKLSKKLVNIPLEYVSNAIDWLKKEKGIEHIAVTGISAGASYMLLAASYMSEISAVVATVPLDYVCQGNFNALFGFNGSMFTYKGKGLYYTKWKNNFKGIIKALFKRDGLSRIMRNGYDNLDYDEKSRIAYENMKADILLLGVDNDDCWPSEKAVTRISERLKQINYPYVVESYIYKKASHLLSDGMADKRIASGKRIFAAEKKYPKECEKARKDSLEKTIDFFKRWSIKVTNTEGENE